MTGLSVTLLIALTISPHKLGFSIKAEPAPVLVTLGTGQPMFTSKKSILGFNLSDTAAAFAKFSGLAPNNWTPVSVSSFS